jgi:hypothetical protein
MSVPTAVALGSKIVASINPMDVLMSSVNTNPYLIGIMMLMLNLGGRFLSLEISKEQEKFMSQPMVRRFFLFAVLFVATRNIVISIGLTIIVVILLGYLFNENSDLCLWKSCIASPSKKDAPTTSYIGLTAEEVMILKRLQDKQAAGQKPAEKPAAEKEKHAPTASDLYSNSMRNIFQ